MSVWLILVSGVTAFMLACSTAMGFTYLAVTVVTGRLTRDFAAPIVLGGAIGVSLLSFLAWAKVLEWTLGKVSGDSSVAVVCLLFAVALVVSVTAVVYVDLSDERFGRFTRRKAGRIGEAMVAGILAKAGFDVVHDLFVPASPSARQLDHVVRAGRYLVVVETKNWQGAVVGAPDAPTWRRAGEYGDVEAPNPVHQVRGQVGALSAWAGGDVVGYVAFTDRAKFPRGMPAGTLRAHDLVAKLKALEASSGTDASGERDARWRKVLSLARDADLQNGLRARHGVAAGGLPIRAGEEAAPYLRKCESCGARDPVLRAPSRPGYGWYWRCECDANTPATTMPGWSFRYGNEGVECRHEDGRVLPVPDRGETTPSPAAEAPERRAPIVPLRYGSRPVGTHG